MPNPPKIRLLQHEREADRKRNSGRVLKSVLGDGVVRQLWSRTDSNITCEWPDNCAVLWISDEAQALSADDCYEELVVIDGTWQEARKIINKTPQLSEVKKVYLPLSITEQSAGIRRNQIEGGLSTAEVIAKVFLLLGYEELASRITRQFNTFTKALRAGLPYDDQSKT